jgi:predicted metalloprotease
MPQTYAEVDRMLKTNPLYSQSLPPTSCSIADIDLTRASITQIELHLNTFVDCLMATWRPPVIGAGFELPHPSVTVYARETTSACGALPMENAVYCSADQQIYFARDLIDAFPHNYQTMRFMAEAVLAHEFGHTVQYRTMILISETVLQEDATTKAAENDLSRRLEMQADCFAGLFFNAVAVSTELTNDDRQNITGLYTTLGGTTAYSDDHGTGANRAHWLGQGLMSTTPSSCSTFTAAASSVG